MGNPIIGYCVRCKTKKEIKDPEQITLKNGRKAVRGVCPICETKMFKFLKWVLNNNEKSNRKGTTSN